LRSFRGSAVKYLRYGGQRYMGFVASSILFVAVKKLQKSTKLQQVKPCAFLGHSVDGLAGFCHLNAFINLFSILIIN